MIRLLPFILALGVLAGCSSSSAKPAAKTAGPYAATYRAVCSAASAARGGDAKAARTRFLDGAHQGIHELAAVASKRSRPAAGRMLEAKERVEHDLSAGAKPNVLAADLAALSVTARSAIAATGAPRPQPCSEVPR
jgi:hypothetical protein